MGNSDQLELELATSLSSLTSSSTSLNDATTSLTTAAASFTAIVQKIELKFKALAAYEESIVERKQILDELGVALDARELKVKRDESEVMRKLNELRDKEVEWENKVQQMKANMAAAADAVTLSVGGAKFQIEKQWLTPYPDSFFTTMLQTAQNNSNKFCISRDPKYFPTIVTYLRDGRFDKVIKEKDVINMRDEFAFYKIPFPECEVAEKLSTKEIIKFAPDSDLLSSEYKKVISSWIPKSHFHLLYKGTKDGFAPETYHDKCDSRGPTLTLILSIEGHLFGGYGLTSISHDSPSNTERHALHSDSFLFTLTNPQSSLHPTMFPLLPGNWSTRYTPLEHLHMGWGRWGYDLALSKTPHLDKKSYFGFPYAFKDTTGHGKLTFTGSEYFTVREVEVFSVVPEYAYKTSN